MGIIVKKSNKIKEFQMTSMNKSKNDMIEEIEEEKLNKDNIWEQITEKIIDVENL